MRIRNQRRFGRASRHSRGNQRRERYPKRSPQPNPSQILILTVTSHSPNGSSQPTLNDPDSTVHVAASEPKPPISAQDTSLIPTDPFLLHPTKVSSSQ